MMDKGVFRQVRLCLYLALLLNGVIVWAVPFSWHCSLPGGSCFACGLKKAVSLLACGDLRGAFESNMLILPLLLSACFILCDVICILTKKAK